MVACPQLLFEECEHELWRVAAGDQRSGKLRADRFHLYVGHNDGAPLEPVADEVTGGWCQSDRRGAKDLAAKLATRYPQVWVVTTVGSWDASSPR